ncbi:hypothetical protein CU044_1390 [Streptomyces sp. L-9-10]|nr:hypothetical protein CU044_1390 [Streptomyces sp. L-9-10]
MVPERQFIGGVNGGCGSGYCRNTQRQRARYPERGLDRGSAAHPRGHGRHGKSPMTERARDMTISLPRGVDHGRSRPVIHTVRERSVPGPAPLRR